MDHCSLIEHGHSARYASAVLDGLAITAPSMSLNFPIITQLTISKYWDSSNSIVNCP